jgi:hypothetical protein
VTTWDRRDLAVLRAVAKKGAVEGGFLHLSRNGRTLGLDLDDNETHLALLALRDAGYIDAEVTYTGGGATFTRSLVTGRGLRALGDWPLVSPLSPATLAALLERVADQAPTDDEATAARSAARYVAGLAADTVRAALVAAGSRLLRQRIGL